MIRKLSLLLVVVILTCLFAACSNDTDAPVQPSQGVEATPAGNDKTDDSTDEVPDDGTFRLPIVDEPVTLTQWRAFTSTQITTPAECAANILIEQLTNVKIDYQIVSTANSREQYNLLITSGDYPDLFFQNDTDYVGGFDKGIRDGVFLRLNDIIDKWAPNYKALLDSSDDIRKQSTTDEGNIACFTCIQDGNQPAWIGPMIRVDYLEDVGISSVPETFDELYNALVKFRDELSLEKPLSIGYLGYHAFGYGIMSGFDVAPTFYNQNGTVKYGFIEEGFREYLQTMSKWYSEGLIDPTFYSNVTDFAVNTEDMINNKIGVAEHVMYTMPKVYAASSNDPDFTLRAMPFPRKTKDDVAHFRRYNEIVGNTPVLLGAHLADDVAKLEVAVRWMDFRYEKQGYTILNYGIEGESFVYDENGTPQFTELIYNNPEGISFGDMMTKYTDSKHGAFYIWARENIAFSEDELAAYDIWGDSASGDWVMPPATMTAEEGEEYATIYGDIETFVQEMVVKFITGQESLDKFDSFVDRIKSMGIERCIELKQAALDRYLNR